jgi:hypothetical protein
VFVSAASRPDLKEWDAFEAPETRKPEALFQLRGKEIRTCRMGGLRSTVLMCNRFQDNRGYAAQVWLRLLDTDAFLRRSLNGPLRQLLDRRPAQVPSNDVLVDPAVQEVCRPTTHPERVLSHTGLCRQLAMPKIRSSLKKAAWIRQGRKT